MDYRQARLETWWDHGTKPKRFPTVDILDLLPGFEETVSPYSGLDGAAGIVDIALLRALARRFPACEYLEIGLGRGDSLANVAAIASRCVSVSLSAEDMRVRGMAQRYIQIQGDLAPKSANVRYIGADSRRLDRDSLGGKFDLVFVDGDHSREAVEHDTRMAFELLRNERSVIVWHDYGWGTETPRPEVLEGILDGAPEITRTNLYHVSNSCCALYTREPVPSRVMDFFEPIDKVFELTITARRIER